MEGVFVSPRWGNVEVAEDQGGDGEFIQIDSSDEALLHFIPGIDPNSNPIGAARVIPYFGTPDDPYLEKLENSLKEAIPQFKSLLSRVVRIWAVYQSASSTEVNTVSSGLLVDDTNGELVLLTAALAIKFDGFVSGAQHFSFVGAWTWPDLNNRNSFKDFCLKVVPGVSVPVSEAQKEMCDVQLANLDRNSPRYSILKQRVSQNPVPFESAPLNEDNAQTVVVVGFPGQMTKAQFTETYCKFTGDNVGTTLDGNSPLTYPVFRQIFTGDSLVVSFGTVLPGFSRIHDANTTSGMSGGPVLAYFKAENLWKVVGLHIGQGWIRQINNEHLFELSPLCPPDNSPEMAANSLKKPCENEMLEK